MFESCKFRIKCVVLKMGTRWPKLKIQKFSKNFPILSRIFGAAAVHFVLALGLEELIIKNERVWKSFRKFQKRRHIGKRYASIEDEILNFEEWPPKKRTESV